MSWRVLFVDDEVDVLRGLRQRLYRYRQSWDMHFAKSGEEALAKLAERPFDVIVSDMRMPGMDGAELLKRVKEICPGMVRIVLSGHAETESAMRAAAVTHQFLNKPCDPGVLENVIERAASLHKRVSDPSLLRVIGTIHKLPAMPRVYAELTRALEDDKASLASVASILQKDLSLCAKLLQIVNSAFFRLSRRITRIEDAVTYLGLNTIQNLALAAEVFGQAGDLPQAQASFLLRLQEHSLLVAAISQRVLGETPERDDAFVAGLLHDVGWLVLMAQLPERMQQLQQDLAAQEGPLREAEQRVLGVTHAEIGGYLLGIWGLPYPIVEAAFAHHQPWDIKQAGIDILAAVHVADRLAAEHGPPLLAGAAPEPLADSYLQQLGAVDSLASWRAMATEQAAQRGAQSLAWGHGEGEEEASMTALDKLAVLCVDDEPELLAGIGLHLRRHYALSTATSGAQGLQILDTKGPFAVVMSDMRMPGMTGAQFLAEVRQRAPDTVRMLLTGHADLDSAIAAVNEGQIFRFLTKPCPPPQMLAAFEAARRQHELLTAEKVLLEQTLRGSVQALTDVLALSNPLAFGRASRIKQHAAALARALGLPDIWQIEVAAMLSQLGTIILPAETVEKHLSGQTLSSDERTMVARMPQVVEDLLKNIPRLDAVRAILAELTLWQGGKSGLMDAAAVLAVAVDYDALEASGLSAPRALDALQARAARHRPAYIEAFIRVRQAAEQQQVRQIDIRELCVGQVLMEEVRSTSGVLLVARGFEVTAGVVERLKNFRGGSIALPLRVIDPRAGESAAKDVV